MTMRDKKIFLNEQFNEIEENKMGKTRDFFQKIGDKGVFREKMGTIKERNIKDRTKAEDIKKRWEEYKETIPKKVLMTLITMIVWSLT